MFNRSYQIRAVKAAGGGHRIAASVLAATEGGAFYRPEKPIAPLGAKAKVAAGGCRKRGDTLQLALEFPLSDDDLAQEFERIFG